MVVNSVFKDLFESSVLTSNFNLPTVKENPMLISFNETEVPGTVYNGPKPPLPFAQSDLIRAKILSCKRLSAVNKDCKHIYEVTLDATNCKLNFKAGDTIGIIPQNNAKEVDAVLNHLMLSSVKNACYELVPCHKAKIPAHIPIKSSLEHVLRHCVDLRSVIKKTFLLALSQHTKDETERKLLEYLSSKEGSAAYNLYVLSKNLCLLDIFSIFKSCKPPIELVLSHLPRLLPRPYSIVNSGLKNSSFIKICFSVINITSDRKGVTTGMLEEIILNNENDLEEGINQLNISDDYGNTKKDSTISYYLRKNMKNFQLPEDLEVPMLMIGSGTGVAPFIGFLEERLLLRTQCDKLNIGDVWLFLGCRNRDWDFIYKDILNNYVTRYNMKLDTVFSRNENNGINYVQDLIKLNGKEVSDWIVNGASVFICGNLNNMESQVRQIIVQCLVQYQSKTEEEAKQFLLEMDRNTKYKVDLWN